MPDSTITVTATCKDSPRTVIKSGSFSWIIDEPPLFGGKNEGPSPVETLLAAIAGCIPAIGQWVANEQGIKINHIQVDVNGVINADKFFGENDKLRAGFSNITVKINADADWSKEQKNLWLSEVKKRCPVIDNVENSTPISVEFLSTCYV